MKVHTEKTVFQGYIVDVDFGQGLFFASIELTFEDGRIEELELETSINELSPLELPYLTKGAYFQLDPVGKPGQRFTFSRKVLSKEDIQRAEQEATTLHALLQDNLQFPFVSRQVRTTEDSDSFKQVTGNVVEVPLSQHVGAFGVIRRFHIHEGVDLYAAEGTSVVAMEDGVVVYVGPFTGPKAGSPHWNDTDMVMIEGKSGVIGYGEIQPISGLAVGDKVHAREWIGSLTPVLKKDKGRPMTMLHLEYYVHGTKKPVTEWALNTDKPEGLLDPTPLLLRAAKLS